MVYFPMQIQYNPIQDENLEVLKYVAGKCGLLDGKKSALEINYQVIIKLKIILTRIGLPTMDNSATFDCPIPVTFYLILAWNQDSIFKLSPK